MLEFGLLGFASPWILTALLLLPLIWWLLRITPPSPQSIAFPAIRLLFGLESEEQTPQSSPLWLILLRIAALTALILGLAGPLINPAGGLRGSGPVLLVIDDGWAAAADWPRRAAAIEAIVARAERQDRAIAVLTTARRETPHEVAGPFGGRDARSYLSALQPKPWPVDRAKATAALDGFDGQGSVSVVWLSDGLDGAAAPALMSRLQRLGSLEIFVDPPETLPIRVFPPKAQSTQLTVAASRFAPDRAQPVRFRARAADGRLLVERKSAFPAGEARVEATFDLPLELRNQVSRIDVDGEATAAAVVLLDDRWQRRSVGLASSQPLDSGPALLSETYYVERALAPFSDILRQPISRLVTSDRSVILIPDAEPVAAGDRASLEGWMRRGGIMVRFAGPVLAASKTDDFTPVPLRRGGRTLSGALLWSEPAKLAAFDESSPFFGLPIPEDVTISRQVLAQPSVDLAGRSWARLTDGTPLVTAEKQGDGWLVLVHTTASTAWSNLPLSGLFVEMLRRVVWLSRSAAMSGERSRSLAPYRLLDGFGRLVAPSGAATAIDLGKAENLEIGPAAPPGYYGDEDTRHAVNLAPLLGALEPLRAPPGGVAVRDYSISAETSLAPWLLFLALLLILADTIASLYLRGLLPKWLLALGRRKGLAALLLLLALPAAVSLEARAQERLNAETFALEATESTRLAYLRTGIAEVDEVSQAGLAGLSTIIRRRTAAELGAPLAVDPARDELAFFPLLYWPVDVRQPPLSAEAVRRLNRYLEHGGTIVFDTRDQHFGGASGSGEGAAMLRNLAQGLNIPALVPVPPEHVLTRAFYLMQDFPGRWTGGRVWVEGAGNRINDGVSRVIVGGHDWAAAWSVDEHGRALYPVVPGGEKQREMAYRFGVNLVMYALTGNYKADQVHVPAILERLGQ